MALLSTTAGWFLDLRGQESLEQAVGAVARASSANLTIDQPADTITRESGVLLLDDANECPDVAALTDALMDVVPVPVTSHTLLGLDDEHVVSVPSLPADSAADLLKQLAPPSADLCDTLPLLRQLGGIPLAIELAVEPIRGRFGGPAQPLLHACNALPVLIRAARLVRRSPWSTRCRGG